MASGDDLTPNENTVKIVSRAEWGALPEKGAKVTLAEPAKYILVTWAGTNTCSTKEECTMYVQELQRDHMYNKGYDDIRYNFLVGGDGYVYEGRGWNAEPEKHEVFPKFHGSSIEIGQLGRNRTFPTQEMIDVVYALVDYGSDAGLLSKYTGMFPVYDDSPENNLI